LTSSRPAVFLDRDGVLNERPAPHTYVSRVEDFRWLPGAADGVSRLAALDCPVIVVSNQRGVARGLVSEDVLGEIEAKISGEFERRGGRLTAFYYCPHELDEGCDCRKPRPGLLLLAAREHGIELGTSVMIGDSESDVEAGRAAGCATIRIAPPGESSAADTVVSGFDEAAAAASRLLGR
jgi:D-glycero-D-manno-heptose 1,7-bisphosphate phosphatase